MWTVDVLLKIKINSIRETNDSCNEIHHKRLQCGRQKLFIAPIISSL